MINYYQPHMLHFLGKQYYRLPKNIRSYFYHSFEDGLWDVLKKKKIKKNSCILIPDFYCLDVVTNIRNHGYRVEYYCLDKHFQISEKAFTLKLKSTRPTVIIIFNACGIASTLLKNTNWLKTVTAETLIIEDCVHQLLNREEISLIHPNHIVMDSLRKVSPLAGSFMYGSPSVLNFNQETFHLSKDLIFTICYFYFFRFLLEFSHLFKSSYLLELAFKILKKHDDIIGDSKQSIKGIPLHSYIFPWLDIRKIERIKHDQVLLYAENTNKINSPYYYSISILQNNYDKLHVFPLGITDPQLVDQLTSYLHARNILATCKFMDSPWAKNKAVLFLPLGPHIATKDILYIVESLTDFSPTTQQSQRKTHTYIY